MNVDGSWDEDLEEVLVDPKPKGDGSQRAHAKKGNGAEEPPPPSGESDYGASTSTAAINAGAQFKLTWLHEIIINLDQEWLVKKLFPRIGVVSLYGDSQSFKTFVAIHLCYCVVLAKDFAGRKVKISAPCIYIAAEDSEGVKKRFLGYYMANETDLPPRSEIPIAVMEATPNLGSLKGDLDKLSATVNDALKAMGKTAPALIVIDTLSQTLGDAEENTTGMQAFMHNATKLSKHFGCCVIAIHHVGHTEKDRERGGSQIKGNADGRICMERAQTPPMIPIDGSKTFETVLHVVKVKNGPDAIDLKATLFEFKLGQDSDGDDVTTLVVDRIEETETAPEPATDKRTAAVILRHEYLAAYDRLADGVTETHVNGKSVRKVADDAIRDELRDRGFLDKDESGKITSTARSQLRRTKTELLGKTVIIERKGLIWRPK
jgi:KaiC/GvpD/RAD55 family RecA-like ATPase